MLKMIIASLLFCTAIIAAAAEDKKDASVMPTEITLTNGAVLRDVSVVRWDSDYVVLRHVGGVDPIRFENIADPKPEMIRAIRAAALTAAESKPATAATRMINGQVFIVTRSGENVKMGDIRIRFIAAEEMQPFLASLSSLSSDYEAAAKEADSASNEITRRAVLSQADAHVFEAFNNAPKEIAVTTTDAEGRFSVTLPSGRDFYVLARNTRVAGTLLEWYVWCRFLKPDESSIVLSNGDLWHPEK